MLPDSVLTVLFVIGFMLFASLPLLAPRWRLLLLGFLIFLAFEGLARRISPSYQQWIYLAKDAILLPIYLGCYLEYSHRRRRQLRNLYPKSSWVLFLLLVAVVSFQMLNPDNRGALLAFISFKIYFWYLPLILVACAWTQWDEKSIMTSREIYWIIVPVSLFAIFQVTTGWGTAYREDSIVATGGTYTRAIDAGTLVNISSTLFGGRLATFSAVWTLSLYTLFLYHINSVKRHRSLIILIMMSFTSLILGFNNTAMAATLLGMVILTVFASSVHAFDISLGLLRALMGVVILGLLVFVFWQFALQEKDSIITTAQMISFFGRLFSPAERLVVTRNVWQGIQASYAAVGFWGWGVGSLTQGADYVDPSLGGGYSFMHQTKSESILLRTLIELGVLGTIAFILAYLSLFWYLLRHALALRQSNSGVGIMVMGSTVVLLLFLVMAYKHHGFASDPTLQTYVYVWVGSGLGMIARGKAKAGIGNGVKPSRMGPNVKTDNR